MRSPHAVLLLALLSLGGGAGAAAQDKDEAASVHINAVKNPDLHSYRAVVAGLDKFDELHALAPAAPQLRFQIEARSANALAGDPLVVRIAADDFSIPLAIDQERRFTVPRSQAAYDAKAEVLLNRKKRDARFETYVRTPGLADNQYRLGDVRLDCQVKVAIGKEEIPFWANALVNSVLLTTDWCSWFKGETPKGGDRTWPRDAPARLKAAILRDGERTLALKVEGKTFRLPIGDTSWSNDAIVDVEYALKETPPSPSGLVIAPDETRGSAP